MNFGTIRDSHLTIDLAGSVDPLGSGLAVLGLVGAAVAGVVVFVLLIRGLLGRAQ